MMKAPLERNEKWIQGLFVSLLQAKKGIRQGMVEAKRFSSFSSNGNLLLRSYRSVAQASTCCVYYRLNSEKQPNGQVDVTATGSPGPLPWVYFYCLISLVCLTHSIGIHPTLRSHMRFLYYFYFAHDNKTQPSEGRRTDGRPWRLRWLDSSYFWISTYFQFIFTPEERGKKGFKSAQ